MNVPGGLTTQLPELGIQPDTILNDLRRGRETFDRMPLWFWDTTNLNPTTTVAF